jgi:hypothetical protein
MDLIKQHISPYLYSFVNEDSDISDDVFIEIQKEYGIEFIEIVCYLNQLFNLTFSLVKNDLAALHIHFENDINESQKLLIAEFLGVKLFKYYHSSDNQFNNTNISLIEIIAGIEKKLNGLEMRCPDGASGKNGGNRLWKNWVKDKKDNKTLLEFYRTINENSLLKPKSIFNTQINFCNTLCQKFEFKPYYTLVNGKNKSYILLNATQTLNEIDNINNEIIDQLDSIILFDCERKSLMSNYSFDEIYKWNTDYDTNFTKYLIITFGNDFRSINAFRNKIDLIKDRFKIKNTTTYTILNSEIDSLLKRKEKSSIAIKFVGFESSSFWDTFLLETSIRELYELRSIKLMNIYSTCYNDEIKEYIIEDLFSKKESSDLISSNTKMAILELRDEDIETLKEALSSTLDFIIRSDIKSEIIENLTKTTTIIFEDAIIRNVKLLAKITNCLSLTRITNLKTWSDFLNSDSNCFLILSYRDQGKFPNFYYPNLLEIEFDAETITNALLINFLFGHHYKWSKYYLYKDIFKLLTHPIRESHFQWNELKNTIEALKPEQKLNIDWNLENEYSNSEQRELYKIKLKGHKLKTAYGSDLFIISDDKNISRKVVKIDFLKSIINDESIVYVQNLDEIQENINIYDKIVDKKQQEEELEVIRRQFKLGNETAGRLWKVLLKKLAESLGEDKLYLELKKYFETKGLKIVSQFHFKNSWVNPQSESLAPLSKRVFIELCDYLKIPKIYFVIIQRIRNATKQSSRQSTRQMNQLLKDLFNDGCFDAYLKPREIITNKLGYYKAYHPLDDLGIDENYLADNLVTLVELIQPELKLAELETIEKISNE